MTPPDKSKGAFMPCRVNGVLSYALLDTGAEATIISDDIYHRINTNTSKLETPRKPVFGANNLPLDVVGETELTLELGSIKAQHKVLVRSRVTTTSVDWHRFSYDSQVYY